MSNKTTRDLFRTTYHRDATVTIWSVTRQGWVRTGSPSDDTLASLSESERSRVMRHCGMVDMTPRTRTTHFVVPAPGHYGDRTRVVSAHRSIESARKASGKGYVVREGSLRKGVEFVRSAESIYPIA